MHVPHVTCKQVMPKYAVISLAPGVTRPWGGLSACRQYAQICSVRKQLSTWSASPVIKSRRNASAKLNSLWATNWKKLSSDSCGSCEDTHTTIASAHGAGEVPRILAAFQPTYRMMCGRTELDGAAPCNTVAAGECTRFTNHFLGQLPSTELYRSTPLRESGQRTRLGCRPTIAMVDVARRVGRVRNALINTNHTCQGTQVIGYHSQQ